MVPVRILYDTPDGRMKLFCKVKVVYGEPMPAAQFAMESRRDLKTLRANKQALLDAWSEDEPWLQRGVECTAAYSLRRFAPASSARGELCNREPDKLYRRIAKTSHFGGGGIAQAMTERVRPIKTGG